VRIAYDKLVKHLAKYRYTPTGLTPGLWKHHTCPITFCLVVDGFGIKYVRKEHAEHLISALHDEYPITLDW